MDAAGGRLTEAEGQTVPPQPCRWAHGVSGVVQDWGEERRSDPVEKENTVPASHSFTAFTRDQVPSAIAPDGDGFELDVRIVEAGPVAAVLLEDTDDGCDTVRGSDC